MRNKSVIFGFVLLGVVTGCAGWSGRSAPPNAVHQTPTLMSGVAAVPEGQFRYGGSTSWAMVRREVDIGIRFSFPKFQLRYVDPSDASPSSEKGIEMLLNDQLDFVQSANGIPEHLRQMAAQRGKQLKEVKVAIDGIVIAVHPQLELPGITVEQLNAIKAGRVTNWREVGGVDRPITLYHKGGDPTVQVAFTKITNSTEGFRKVAGDPGGLYWSSASQVVTQCGVKALPIGEAVDRFVPPYQLPGTAPSACSSRTHNQVNAKVFQTGAYPLVRHLSVIVLEDGTGRQQAGEAYAQMLLTQQGQDLLRQAGYLNIVESGGN
jgi:phosphate transport system substrate-binding protein